LGKSICASAPELGELEPVFALTVLMRSYPFSVRGRPSADRSAVFLADRYAPPAVSPEVGKPAAAGLRETASLNLCSIHSFERFKFEF
jgi:hypothetical protein